MHKWFPFFLQMKLENLKEGIIIRTLFLLAMSNTFPLGHFT